MIDIHQAIYALNPTVITIRGDVAFDAEGNEVTYDKFSAEAKLAEMQAAELAAQQAAVNAKASAQAKLAALGLTPAEVTAIIGN